MNFENTSKEFKRAVQALAYAMSTSEDIVDDKEQKFFRELVEHLEFDPSFDALFEFIDKRCDDYEDYEQISKSHFTGVWLQKMKKESGEEFTREILGNEFTAPLPKSSFLDTIEGNVMSKYTATQTYCFFIPFNTLPEEFKDHELDNNGHAVFSLEDINYGGKYNGVVKHTLELIKTRTK